MTLSVFRDTIRRIPRGRVASYGQVARAAGHPGAARQVVWALQRAKALPWHRVVGANGRILLGGESAIEQRIRLESEGVMFRHGRVEMERHRFSFDSRVPHGPESTRKE